MKPVSASVCSVESFAPLILSPHLNRSLGVISDVLPRNSDWASRCCCSASITATMRAACEAGTRQRRLMTSLSSEGGQVVDVEDDEAVEEGVAELLPAAVQPGRVLRGEQPEGRVRRHRLLRLGQEQLAVVVQQPVQRLQHLTGSEVQLVQQQPPPLPHRLHQHALAPLQLPSGRL